MTDTPTGLASLIERLEASNAHDWYLRQDIFNAVTGWKDGDPPSAELFEVYSSLSAALDGKTAAAINFMAAVLPGWHAILYTENNMAEIYDAKLRRRKGIRQRVENADTLARALLIATLRALAKDTTDD